MGTVVSPLEPCRATEGVEQSASPSASPVTVRLGNLEVSTPIAGNPVYHVSLSDRSFLVRIIRFQPFERIVVYDKISDEAGVWESARVILSRDAFLEQFARAWMTPQGTMSDDEWEWFPGYIAFMVTHPPPPGSLERFRHLYELLQQ
jgi:hypothetical protein